MSMRRTLSTSLVLFVAAVVGTSPPALASIIGVLPQVALFTPPDVSLDQTQNDFWIMGFDEQQCIILSADLTTDQGVIPAGSSVSCHFFHYDPVNSGTLVGRAVFDVNILGVISTSSLLDASDCPCGLGTVIYPTSPNPPCAPGAEAYRGLEGPPQADGYRVSANGLGIEIHVDVPLNSFTDQVRVITECVP